MRADVDQNYAYILNYEVNKRGCVLFRGRLQNAILHSHEIISYINYISTSDTRAWRYLLTHHLVHYRPCSSNEVLDCPHPPPRKRPYVHPTISSLGIFWYCNIVLIRSYFRCWNCNQHTIHHWHRDVSS